MERDVNIAFVQPVAAFVASIVLILAGKKRVWEIVAIIASAVWLAMVLGVFAWPVKRMSSGLVIGAALTLAGVVVYLRTSNKREVTAATVLTILGGILLLGALGHLR